MLEHVYVLFPGIYMRTDDIRMDVDGGGDIDQGKQLFVWLYVQSKALIWTDVRLPGKCLVVKLDFIQAKLFK